MNINRFVIATNELDEIRIGDVLAFRENVELIDTGDAIIVRASDGRERLLVVRHATSDGWLIDEAEGDIVRQRRLERVDDHRLRIQS